MIDWLRWQTRWYLSKLPFYRKHIGGKWYRVIPDYGGYYDTYWINRKPFYNEKVLSVEKW
jgi:hypothetical protein